MKKYQQETTRGITESSEQQDNESEETSENEWENIKQVVTMVASQKVGYKERKKRNDWYAKECQIKVEEKN
jgi:hypothetical protein